MQQIDTLSNITSMHDIAYSICRKYFTINMVIQKYKVPKYHGLNTILRNETKLIYDSTY